MAAFKSNETQVRQWVGAVELWTEVPKVKPIRDLALPEVTEELAERVELAVPETSNRASMAITWALLTMIEVFKIRVAPETNSIVLTKDVAQMTDLQLVIHKPVDLISRRQ